MLVLVLPFNENSIPVFAHYPVLSSWKEGAATCTHDRYCYSLANTLPLIAIVVPCFPVHHIHKLLVQVVEHKMCYMVLYIQASVAVLPCGHSLM